MWTSPATRMKSRREHRVPLSVALLKELYTEAGNPYLFIGPKTGATLSVTALVAALRRVGRNETAHGFQKLVFRLEVLRTPSKFPWPSRDTSSEASGAAICSISGAS